MADIKGFFGKQSIGFYIGTCATILILVGTIILGANGNMPYYNDYNAVVPLMGCLAVIVAIALLVVSQFVKNPHLKAMWIAVVVLATVGLIIAISMRVESMAYILGSDLENDNPLARPALNNFFVGAIIDGIGIVAIVVASFFKVTKES